MSRDIFAGRPALRRSVYRAMFACVPLVPMQISRIIAYFIALVGWACDHRGRRVVAANLAPLIPGTKPQALRRAVRRSYVAFSWMCVENLNLHRLPVSMCRAPFFQICDPWHSLAKPPLAGPAILVCPHVNFELAPAYLNRLNKMERLHAISLTHDDPEIDQLFDRVRATMGVQSLLVDEAPLASLRHLHDGHLIGIVGDRDYTGSGLSVPVGRRHIRIPVGPAALSVQTGAPIIPTFMARHGHTRFRFYLGKPIRPDTTLAKRYQVQGLTEQLTAWYTRCLRAAPCQWVAFHPVWEEGVKGLGAPPCWV
ncbi:MAG: lysophospholipid acyltransferase family protein [Planctomycetota bacterium]|jgi:lauroyl/myristoyl acyltransferase|nr:lysophospholipid acyltransferase family protein [Planctomycetota bacterium]